MDGRRRRLRAGRRPGDPGALRRGHRTPAQRGTGRRAAGRDRDVYDAEVHGPYRVLRGGGWSDGQWSCRASVRRRSHPRLRIDDVGFRIARSVTGG
ncbi:SUMF1/EgtB/PvdO family nonheme iron enzyme [Geodermatophilus sp. SYSU D01180]